ncbi:ribosomal protein S10 domain-containing protein [Pisolithus orientalis]|uniref:ribosomal protein S10 domain-containing protein n=1 Tax=Pisolithus orientalis TaxID=936130 RepID=UPI002225206F|nr:ribosomal protein S10 domain-containing protein [Pisolithus orientalis]KAI6008722.1 ribosomal protein S10 domain-containing protein [Pisolithus orientalis]
MFVRSPRISLPVLARCTRFSTANTPHVNEPLKTSIKSQTNSEPRSALTEPELASMVIRGRAIYPPTPLPRPHNIPVASLHFRSHHPFLLDTFAHFAEHAASALGIPASRPVHLPTQRSMWTVIRGPFVHKKSQENFERRVHKRAIKAWDADPEIVNMWVKYLRKHMMPGVGMRVTKWERAPVGIGQQVFQRGMEKLRLDTDAAKVRALADKIVQQELMASDSDTPLQTVADKQS